MSAMITHLARIAQLPSNLLFERDKRLIHEKYASIRLKLAADEQRELDEAERKFWAGEYSR